jgi:hypothetical protein
MTILDDAEVRKFWKNKISFQKILSVSEEKMLVLEHSISVQLVLKNLAALHDKLDSLQFCDVGRGVSYYGD